MNFNKYYPNNYRFITLFLLIFNSFYCVNCFFSYDKKKDLAALIDVTECTWCIKQLSKEIINSVTNNIKDTDDEVEIRLRLHKSDLDMLKEFSYNDESWIRVEQVLSILTPRVVSVKDDIRIPESKQGISPLLIIAMSTGAVSICAAWLNLSRLPPRLIIILLTIVFFYVGITWNWWKLYSEEYSRRVHLLPAECVQEETSWFHSFKAYLIDPNCGEYFKASVDDPFAMVSPHQVVLETMSMFFISPLKMIISTMSLFIHTLTDNLMWPLNWIVQILLTIFLFAAGTVVIITVLAGVFNLDLKFSTCLVSGELKPSKKIQSAIYHPSKKMVKKRAVRPTDLALFPSPPSPFR